MRTFFKLLPALALFTCVAMPNALAGEYEAARAQIISDWCRQKQQDPSKAVPKCPGVKEFSASDMAGVVATTATNITVNLGSLDLDHGFSGTPHEEGNGAAKINYKAILAEEIQDKFAKHSDYFTKCSTPSTDVPIVTCDLVRPLDPTVLEDVQKHLAKVTSAYVRNMEKTCKDVNDLVSKGKCNPPATTSTPTKKTVRA